MLLCYRFYKLRNC